MEIQAEDLERLYADSFRGIRSGQITKGKVIAIKPDGVIVDMGSKSEGFIPRDELIEEEHDSINPGDEIEVFVERLRDSDGFIRLSRLKAEEIRSWERVNTAYRKKTPVEGTIIEKIKGGMKVKIGTLKAFLPASHIDTKSVEKPERLIGSKMKFKIISLNQREQNIVVSRRVVIEEELEQKKQETISKLKEGALIKGKVKNITDYGAFIDLGGIDGLLHISDMSWGRISHPSEIFRIGHEVEVVVLKFDQDKEKITLGYKQKTPDPWDTADKRYPPGQRVNGRIISITDFGLFVELEEGIEGLVHISEIDWLKRNIKLSNYFSVGDRVEAVVLRTDKADRRISLSIRKLKPNPWELVKQRYKVGQKVLGRVTRFAEFGAFIQFKEGVEALLHVSDMSWTKKIRHPSEVLRRGQDVEVIIMSIDYEREKISVSMKHLMPDPWIKDIPSRYQLGEWVNGRVSRIVDFGAFIELEGGVEGLLHISQMEKRPDERIEDLFKVGDEVSTRIINIDPSERKIDLSMKIMI